MPSWTLAVLEECLATRNLDKNKVSPINGRFVKGYGARASSLHLSRLVRRSALAKEEATYGADKQSSQLPSFPTSQLPSFFPFFPFFPCCPVHGIMTQVQMVRLSFVFFGALCAIGPIYAGEMPQAQKGGEEKDVIDQLVLNPDLKTFTKLVTKAGLIETLKADGPFTIFAPNDAAFARIPSATLEAWKKDKNLLRKALSYHIVPGKFLTKDFKEGPLKTLSGETLTIKLTPFLTINGAKLVTPDGAASNGTIHTIGAVLTPTKPAK